MVVILFAVSGSAQTIIIKGKVKDGYTLEPIPYASINVVGLSSYGTASNERGEFSLQINGPQRTLSISSVGYDVREVTLSEENEQYEDIFLYAQNAIEAVSVKAPKLKYSNKDNPAVELIRQVVAHRDENRLTGQDYVEYNQYEKIVLGLSNLSEKFKNRKIFKNYQFLFQQDSLGTDDSSYVLPAFMEEKYTKNYYRKNPKTTSQEVLAQKQADFDPRFVDNSGLSNYLKRLYDEVEIYDNNVTILTNQFLSPIANTAPNFYRFYITDTIKNGTEELVELSFFPRNKSNLLFKGKLHVTMDGKYAVKYAVMSVNKEINLNFVRGLDVELFFDKDNQDKYYLTKSDLDIEFSLTGKGKGIRGKRVVMLDNYTSGLVRADSVYQTARNTTNTPSANQTPVDWTAIRPEPLAANEAVVYQNIEGLQNMSSFKRIMDISSLVLAGYKQAGPVEIGPVNTFYSYNPVEGLRLRLGGRTTEQLSERFYAEAFGAYGTRDQQWKYFVSGTYALNKKSPYKFPQHYIRASVSHDTKIPGQNLDFIQEDNILLSFKRGEDLSYLYNEQYRLDYKLEMEGNFAFTSGLNVWKQMPAGVLAYRQIQPDGTTRNISELNTTEVHVGVRWAPNEQFYQGKNYRTPIVNEFPIFNLNYTAGLKNVLNGEYNYHNFTAGAFKRVYLSQLGYADVNIDGTYILGNNIPYPLLTIHRANQTYAYQLSSYNLMNFMEFVSDHHAALQVQYYMNGFLFNKIPLLKKLKLREVFSFKGIYGGLRDSNNPDISNQVYEWQRNSDGVVSSYTFEGSPYMEASVGVANIFKILRVDAVKRLSYLDHPNAPNWGIRARIKFDF
ncbi:DUF5686 and carboxypeptidase regulatory-like domain-containing protein [Sphingobacterium sp. lm-10]|uniref:DUF5686 family protein n=1 Tax=Sphingobacterium sp. lm-10 TaxID=2944904 RepID=UPI0020225958|nr:DUF5686 family protein [Sphingobacterium sp. lm-10]MCL7986972.1 DUF5686 and carboxypeptidase regulatory-like domain-containing protein [Sphingobacterium sp. lm-10]